MGNDSISNTETIGWTFRKKKIPVLYCKPKSIPVRTKIKKFENKDECLTIYKSNILYVKNMEN